MKIKTVSNVSREVGGALALTALVLFLFIGFYVSLGSIWILVIGFLILSWITFSTLKNMRTVVFYSDKLHFHGPLKKEEIIELGSSRVELRLIGGTTYIPSNSVILMNNGEKIAGFRLNDSEWEFESFYHKTLEFGYRWRIHEGHKRSVERNYQLFLKRKETMDSNRK